MTTIKGITKAMKLKAKADSIEKYEMLYIYPERYTEEEKEKEEEKLFNMFSNCPLCDLFIFKRGSHICKYTGNQACEGCPLFEAQGITCLDDGSWFDMNDHKSIYNAIKNWEI